MGGSNPVSGNPIRNITESSRARKAVGYALPTSYIGNAAVVGAEKARKAGARNPGDFASGAMGEAATPYLGEAPQPPGSTLPPTDADIAALEPDKERLRRQRMAALMAGGRMSTIFGGASGGMTTPNNTIGGGTGKGLIGA